MRASFGLSTHLFHEQRLVREHLEAVAAHGFTALELFATRTHFDYRDPAAVEALAGWLQATGLRLHSVHAPIAEGYAGGAWGPALSTAATDAAQRARALDECRAALTLARTIPYEFLVVHLGQPEGTAPLPGDNSRDAARRSVEQLHEAAAEARVSLALEVIPNRLSEPEALVRLLDDLELKGAGVCLDFGHALIGGDVVDAVEAISGALVTTHVHDNRGRTDDHLLPFEGRLDWERALFACQKVGYEGVWMFEPAMSATPVEVLARARRACERFREILAS